MKWKVESRCNKCKRPNNVTIYEELTLEDIAKINACKCEEPTEYHTMNVVEGVDRVVYEGIERMKEKIENKDKRSLFHPIGHSYTEANDFNTPPTTTRENSDEEAIQTFDGSRVPIIFSLSMRVSKEMYDAIVEVMMEHGFKREGEAIKHIIKLYMKGLK